MLLKQYERKYKNFKFIGPSPIDFDSTKYVFTCVWEKLCNFDLKTILKIKKIK